MNNSIHVVLPAVIVAATAVIVMFVDLFAASARSACRPGWRPPGSRGRRGRGRAQWYDLNGGFAVWHGLPGGLVTNGRQASTASTVWCGSTSTDCSSRSCSAASACSPSCLRRYLAQHRVGRGEFSACCCCHLRHDRHGDLDRPYRLAVSSSSCRCRHSCSPASCAATGARARPPSSTSSTAPSPRPCWPSAWRSSTGHGATGTRAIARASCSPTRATPSCWSLRHGRRSASVSRSPRCRSTAGRRTSYEGAPDAGHRLHVVGIKAGAFAGFLRLVGFALIRRPRLVGRADRARPS